ncbi:MAG: replication-relaxation family protein [Candidatus Saccharimonadales bacterium]
MPIRKRFNKLSNHQIQLLKQLYKFRHVTAPLLANINHTRTETTHNALSVLLEQELLSRKYDSSYRIDRKPAVYYLAAKGIGILRAQTSIAARSLHAMYSNKNASDAFIQHNLSALQCYTHFQSIYGDSFGIFTRSEIATRDEFPKSKSDLYLRANEPTDEDHFVILLDDARSFVVKKRLVELFEHYEEEGWRTDDYPVVLLVLGDVSAEKRVIRLAASTLENAGIDDITIMTTTLKAINQEPAIPEIWSKAVLSETEIQNHSIPISLQTHKKSPEAK